MCVVSFDNPIQILACSENAFCILNTWFFTLWCKSITKMQPICGVTRNSEKVHCIKTLKKRSPPSPVSHPISFQLLSIYSIATFTCWKCERIFLVKIYHTLTKRCQVCSVTPWEGKIQLRSLAPYISSNIFHKASTANKPTIQSNPQVGLHVYC